MFASTHRFIRPAFALLGLAALAAAFHLGTVAAQQQAPATKVSQLMKQTLADVSGREVLMLTLDIPPGVESGMWLRSMIVPTVTVNCLRQPRHL